MSQHKSIHTHFNIFSKVFIGLLFVLFGNASKAQIQIGEQAIISYATPKEYEIGGIVVTGTQYLDEGVLISVSGLSVGQKVMVPGDKITRAIENLWKQGLFSDVKILSTKIIDNKIFLDIHLQERPRLSKFSFKGVSKNEADKLREKIKLVQGKVVTENLIQTTKNTVIQFFQEKGFLNAEVKITEKNDSTLSNSEILYIYVTKKKKVKINEIAFEGNKAISKRKLKSTMKDTKEKHWYRIFSTSKFQEESYEKDKIKIISKYNAKGYRDAKIVFDTVYKHNEKTLNIKMKIEEGHKFFFRNISWVGNTKHTSQELDAILGIKKGDIFDQVMLDSRLYMSQSGRDVSSLYMDDGYLFFDLKPVEIKVENDSIDLEMRIYEGKQATVNKISVSGNTKTNDRVIMREIRTKPGQLFSRADIIRTQRELSTLGYFNPEKLNVIPKPNPADGTVDINYIVEEKPSDQIELSGGYGAGRVVGTLGVSFNNFSARNFFNASAWKPLPAGDGQRLSLRFQSNGVYYNSLNLSFVEPWLGGKRPNSLSVSTYYTLLSNGYSTGDSRRGDMTIIGGSVGFGKRLKVPDDFFTLFYDLTYQHYNLNNYGSFPLFTKGQANSLALSQTISRNSTDQPIYPRTGSELTLVVQATPPLSLLSGQDYTKLSAQDHYRWIEYNKWKIKASWFTKIFGNARPMVFNVRAKFGFLGQYTESYGQSPFERFYLGGDGLSGYTQLGGRDIIALRGYQNTSLTPQDASGAAIGATVYDKFTFELRYPISLNPSATIYMLSFLEAGNSWYKFKEYNPFDMKRSVGVGLRLYLPMLGGLLGIDYGYGLDKLPNSPGANGGQFHFSIGGSIE